MHIKTSETKVTTFLLNVQGCRDDKNYNMCNRYPSLHLFIIRVRTFIPCFAFISLLIAHEIITAFSQLFCSVCHEELGLKRSTIQNRIWSQNAKQLERQIIKQYDLIIIKMLRKKGNTTQQKETATQHNLPKAVIFQRKNHLRWDSNPRPSTC